MCISYPFQAEIQQCFEKHWDLVDLAGSKAASWAKTSSVEPLLIPALAAALPSSSAAAGTYVGTGDEEMNDKANATVVLGDVDSLRIQIET